jgi:hypothetical protein
MTPEEHNSWLARAHLAYATVNLLLIAVGIAWVLNAGFWDRTDQIIMTIGMAAISLVNLAFTVPSFVAAWALSKQRPWAKMAAIVAGATAAMYFPFGPAVTVYTYWFLFGRAGRALYDKPCYDSPGQLSPGTVSDASQTDHTKFESQFTPNWR